jgi:hypothetical protein
MITVKLITSLLAVLGMLIKEKKNFWVIKFIIKNEDLIY